MSAPRWTRALLARLAEPDLADEVLGDLEEAHRKRVERLGPLVANILTALESLDMAFALRWQRRRALRRLGRDVPPDLHAARRRRMRLLSWLDFKLGMRMLARYPGMTLVGGAAMTLGIGLGAGGLHLFRELVMPDRSFPEPDRIVGIQNVDRRTASGAYRALHDFERWRTELRTIEELSALANEELNFAPEGELPAPVLAVHVSAAAFGLASTPPIVGRPLLPSDEEPGAPPVAVLSNWLWQARFGGDPNVVGRVATLGGAATTIVGVMPESFQLDVPSGDFINPWGQDLWIPFRARAIDYAVGEGPTLRVFGRLAPDVTIADAQAEVEQLGRVAAAESPETHGSLVPRVLTFSHPFGEGGVSLVRLLSLSTAFVVLVMVLLCANVALMMYARAATREGELVVRSALGASRRRIVGQLFTEAVALAGLATVLGLVLASFGVRWAWDVFERLADLNGARWPAIDTSLTDISIVVAVGLAFVGAVVAGVLPGLKVTRRPDHIPLQQQAGRGSVPTLGRAWGAIIVVQVTLTTLIVPVTVLFGWGTWTTYSVDAGLRTGEYLTVQLEMDGDAAARDGAGREVFRERYRDRFDALREQLAREPAVSAVSIADNFPGHYHSRGRFDFEDPPEGIELDPADFAQIARVDENFFGALGIEVLAGRAFGAADFEGEPRAVVVNESFVERFLGGGSAVGRRIRYRTSTTVDGLPEGGRAPDWMEIVGVIRDVLLYYDPGLPHNAGIYEPLRPLERYPVRLAIRVPDGPAGFIPRLREVARDVSPGLRLVRPGPLDRANAANEHAYASWFRVLVLVGGFAILLTNAGIYAIISFTVSRRTREIGVRVALGADRAGIAWAVLARMARRVAIGVTSGGVLGLVFAYGASEGTLALTPGMWIGAAAYLVAMVGICMAACAVPTRRALRIQPTEALAAEG